MKDVVMTAEHTLEKLGLTAAELTGGTLEVRSPIDGRVLARVHETPVADMAPTGLGYHGVAGGGGLLGVDSGARYGCDGDGRGEAAG